MKIRNAIIIGLAAFLGLLGTVSMVEAGHGGHGGGGGHGGHFSGSHFANRSAGINLYGRNISHAGHISRGSGYASIARAGHGHGHYVTGAGVTPMSASGTAITQAIIATPIITITGTIITATTPTAYLYWGYGYYGGGCRWLYRNAIATGSAYWWDRYYACIGYY